MEDYNLLSSFGTGGIEPPIYSNTIAEYGGGTDIIPYEGYNFDSANTLPSKYTYDTEYVNEVDTRNKITPYEEPTDVSYWSTKSPFRFGSIFTPTVLGDSTIEGMKNNGTLTTTNYEQQNYYPLNMNLSEIDSTWNPDNPFNSGSINSLYNYNLPVDENGWDFSNIAQSQYTQDEWNKMLLSTSIVDGKTVFNDEINSTNPTAKNSNIINLLQNKGTMFGTAIGNTYPNTTNSALSLDPLSLRNQQLTLAQQMQNNQLDYLKQHDSLMTDLQKQTLAQQKALANQQLQAQLAQFNKTYSLQKEQFDWQKSYQNTLLNWQEAEKAHQEEVRNRITAKFNS